MAILAASGVLVASLAACGSEGGAASTSLASGGVTLDNEHELRLLSQLDFADQAVVRFYEPEWGGVLVVETGRLEKPRVITKTTQELGTIALYESLSGKKAPPQLVEAALKVTSRSIDDVARMETPLREETAAPASSSQSTDPSSDGERVGSSGQALSTTGGRAWFKENFCPVNWDKVANWNSVTGDGNFLWNDVMQFHSAAEAVRGDIRYVSKVKPWYSWRDLTVGTVPQGYYEVVHYTRLGIDFIAKAAVSDADGDVYSMCSHASHSPPCKSVDDCSK